MGAHQLQNRFMAHSRQMNARHSNAWLAMRMIGESGDAGRTRRSRKSCAPSWACPSFSIAGLSKGYG